MNSKKIIALIITMILTIGSISVVYSDSPFTDIEDNWARNYIISVYEKGLMNGTSNDKFSPGNPVNKYSVVITIAKMMNAEETANLDELVEKHKVDLEKFKVPSYAQRETAFALEKEIILSDYDLDNMSDKPQATKLDICVYLGRAFKVEQDPSLPIQLFFRDTELIPRAYRGHVNHMIKINVVDGKGDANGDFKPNDLVTRAMFAKMLDEASTAYGEEFGEIDNGKDEIPDIIENEWPEDDEYDEDVPEDSTDYESDTATAVFAKGTIDTIIYSRNKKPKILLESEGKVIKEFYIPEDLIKENVIINGQLSDVYSLRPGMYVEVNAQNGVIRNIATMEFTRDINEKAIIRSIDFVNAEIQVDIMDEVDQTMKEKRVYLKDAKLVDISLSSILMDDLKRGQTVNIFGVEDENGINAITVIAQ